MAIGDLMGMVNKAKELQEKIANKKKRHAANQAGQAGQ